jgi:RNA polymerase sigma factor (sigma-70 family)
MSTVITYDMSEKARESKISNTIDKYGKKLFTFIKDKVHLIEDAEDILQEVWYQFSRLSNIDELESVSGWLYSVSRNKITDLYRKNKSENLEDLGSENEDADYLINDILLADHSANPEISLFKEMFWDVLFEALEEIPESQKLVFILNEIEDKTLQEIADDTGENIKTIISRKAYAVKHLRKKLSPLYTEFFN